MEKESRQPLSATQTTGTIGGNNKHVAAHTAGPKSRSVDEGSGAHSNAEQENRGSGQHFTPLPWDQAVSTATTRKERVEAPTHADGDKSSRRLSGRLAQPKGTLEYEVSGNETLASIAAKFDTTTSELKKLNKLMTQMIWPGQKLFVPDKDYIPSTPTSPATTPVTTPRDNKPISFDIPLVKQTEPPPRGPGIAKAVESPTETERRELAQKKRLSEEEAQQLDKECTERFIKVNVKHITDGQGVISGVLLVTPNAVMFDPNVSDPLVLEHGANTYGLIAPLETVRAVAMYQDIAAMKIKTSPRSSVSRPAVYHADSCPMSQQPDIAPDIDDLDSDLEAPDLLKDIPSGRTRQPSICSCGADSLIDASSLLSTSSLDHHALASTSPAKPAPPHTLTAKPTVISSAASTTKLTQITIPEEDECHELPPVTTPAKTAMDSDTLIDPSQPSLGNQHQTEEGARNANGIETTDMSITEKRVQDIRVTDSSQVKDKVESETDGNSMMTQQKMPDVSETDNTGGSQTQEVDASQNSPLTSGTTSSTSASVPIHPRKPRTTSTSSTLSEEGGGTGGAGGGLLSRTLGSISSLGSFTHSPNFSSLVDFSTGLFVRNHDDGSASGRRVKDISEVDMATPPRPEFSIGNKGPDWSVDIGDDLEVKVPEQTASVPIPSDSNHGNKTHVTNAMSLSEKPELFKDLNDLIPRPALQYEDPPLYLCLRVGRLEKPQVTTCPIEGYTKKRPKPEYWFSIPKDKVDPLYAFFIQWSPELYGEEDDLVDPSSRGFVVVEDDDIEEELEVIDDYFEAKSYNRGRRISLSKGWEVVSSDEVKRRQLEEIPVIPELLTPSAILEEDHTMKLSEVLPPRAEGYAWNLTYCSAKDGFSLKTLYRNNQKVDAPALLVVMDTTGQVFGAMLSCGPKLSDHFYGSGESYLFTFSPEFKHFKWTGNNNFFIKGNPESLAVGSGEGSFGLWLDGDLYHGRTQTCETFNNDILSTTEDFVVKAVETWTFV